jgi:hypothetical protein
VVFTGRGWTLEAGDAAAGVERDDQDVTEGFGLVEVGYVAAVEDVEAAVGKDDAAAGGAVFGTRWGEQVLTPGPGTPSTSDSL